MCRILLLFFVFAEVSVLHQLVQTCLPKFFWVCIFTFSYLTWCFKITMKCKRLKRYKIEVMYSEPNFAYQAKMVLFLLFIFQVNTLIHSHNKHEIYSNLNAKFYNSLTRVDLRDYIYAEICLLPNNFKLVPIL